MWVSERMIAGAASLALVVGLSGCGGSPGISSTTEATVKGVVKLDGQPATEGEVSFDPSNENRQASAKVVPIGKDGTYSVTTLVGPNTVKVGKSLGEKYPILTRRHKNISVEQGENTADLDFETK